MKRYFASVVAVLCVCAFALAAVKTGSNYNIPKSGAGGATVAKVTVKVRITAGDVTVKVTTGNGTSNTSVASQSNGGGPNAVDTDDDLVVTSKDPVTGEITEHGTFRIKGGKFQYKDKNGKWRTRRVGGEQGDETPVAGSTGVAA